VSNSLKQWQLPDLVDLEYFLAQDADVDEARLIRRDRELYRTRLSEEAFSRRDLLRRWLDLRREEVRVERTAPLPGDVAASVLRRLPKLMFALGALAGLGLAWGVLSYSGDLPINLMAALSLLVVLPALLALVSAALGGWHLMRGGSYSGIFGGWLTGTLLIRACRRLYTLGGGSGDQAQLALAGSWGILRGRSGLYSGVVGWFAFRLMQLAGLGFSIAVFLAVFLRGLFADLAFSWQTTARFSSEFVYSVVSLIALPWSWLADPPISHPTLEQVAGSRVYLKEGLQHLSSADLQSWWYFLLWAILVYAVLPRLALFGVSIWGERRAWGKISFHDARTEALVRRMQHPQLKVGQEGEGQEGASPAEVAFPGESRDGFDRLRVLVPAELVEGGDVERWQSDLQRQFSSAISSIDIVNVDEDQDADLLRFFAEGPVEEGLLLVLEGWQPCITATLEYLKALRRHIGKDRLLVVVLVGREGHDGTRARTPDLEFEIWRKRLASLGDPSLQVHNWKEANYE
jgi:hypothetical protein